MQDIHAHAILDMMEGKSFSVASLRQAIIDQFGADARFCTCSAQGLDTDAIISFLQQKGKFMPMDDGFTVDASKRCNH